MKHRSRPPNPPLLYLGLLLALGGCAKDTVEPNLEDGGSGDEDTSATTDGGNEQADTTPAMATVTTAPRCRPASCPRSTGS
jgi:hypothetical protein